MFHGELGLQGRLPQNEQLKTHIYPLGFLWVGPEAQLSSAQPGASGSVSAVGQGPRLV